MRTVCGKTFLVAIGKVDDLVKKLTDEYEVSETTAKENIESLLAEMRKAGLILTTN